MNDDIKDILVDHESRIVRLETEVRNMNGWMKGIDRKLDNVIEKLSYLEGKSRANNHETNNKKMTLSILLALVTNIGLLVAILAKVL